MNEPVSSRPRLRQERGDANIIEYTIVLPICLLVFFFLFMIGYMLNQYALLESAAERGLMIAQKSFSDPNAEKMMSYDGLAAPSTAGFTAVGSPDYDSFTSDPYRFFNAQYKNATIKPLVENAVLDIISQNQLMGDTFLGTTTAEYSMTGGTLSKTATVTVEQEFRPLKMIASILHLNSGVYTLKGEARMGISCQTEFIRNTDFVLDLALRFGISTYAEKISGFFDKITNFFKN